MGHSTAVAGPAAALPGSCLRAATPPAPRSGAQPSPRLGWYHLELLEYADMILARNKIFLVGNRQGTAWEKVLASIKSGPQGCSQLSCTKVLGNLI